MWDFPHERFCLLTRTATRAERHRQNPHGLWIWKPKQDTHPVSFQSSFPHVHFHISRDFTRPHRKRQQVMCNVQTCSFARQSWNKLSEKTSYLHHVGNIRTSTSEIFAKRTKNQFFPTNRVFIFFDLQSSQFRNILT